MKGDGNGVAWSGSDNEENTCIPKQNYTFGERY
jgi:hypothetical protein